MQNCYADVLAEALKRKMRDTVHSHLFSQQGRQIQVFVGYCKTFSCYGFFRFPKFWAGILFGKIRNARISWFFLEFLVIDFLLAPEFFAQEF